MSLYVPQGVKSINNNDLDLSLDHLTGLHMQYDLNSDNMTCMRPKHILHPLPEGETLYDPRPVVSTGLLTVCIQVDLL